MKLSLAQCPHRMPLYESATSAVIFLHGYGADGNDLLSLADMWRQELPHTLFLSPHAPQPCISNPFGGRQWFPLVRFDDEELWKGVNEAAPELNEFIDDVCLQMSIAAENIVLIGFSQGTMMALHVAFRRKYPPKAVIGFSGALVGAEHFAKQAIASPDLFLAHGDADGVVPVEALAAAVSTLQASGREVETYVAHAIGHGIDEQMLLRAGRFLVNALK